MIDVAERNALKNWLPISKLEDEKFKIMIESIGLVLFALSLSLFAREIFLYNIVNCISLKSMK